MKRLIQTVIASFLALSLVYIPVFAQPITPVKPQKTTESGPSIPGIATMKIKQIKPIEPVKFEEVAEVAPIPAPAPEPAPAPAQAQSAPCAAVFTGDYRIDYIFGKESTHNPCSVNGGGCIGLGQDCNGWLINGRLDSPACGLNWRSDIQCQLAYWNWYASKIYGGWDAAYSFRQSHNYW